MAKKTSKKTKASKVKAEAPSKALQKLDSESIMMKIKENQERIAELEALETPTGLQKGQITRSRKTIDRYLTELERRGELVEEEIAATDPFQEPIEEEITAIDPDFQPPLELKQTSQLVDDYKVYYDDRQYPWLTDVAQHNVGNRIDYLQSRYQRLTEQLAATVPGSAEYKTIKGQLDRIEDPNHTAKAIEDPRFRGYSKDYDASLYGPLESPLTNDPFNMADLEQYRPLLKQFAIVVHRILQQEQKAKIYLRGLYYAIKGSSLSFPIGFAEKPTTVIQGPSEPEPEQLTPGPIPQTEYIWPNKQDPGFWPIVIKFARLARLAGELEYDVITDNRVRDSVRMYNEPSEARPDDKRPSLKTSLELSLLPTIEVDIPIILLYCEKASLEVDFDQLADEYYIGYIPAAGFASITNIHEVYQFVKEAKRNAIILTFSDYDGNGLAIPTQLSRYLQRFWEDDVRNISAGGYRPNIVVIPAFITPADVSFFRDNGVDPDLEDVEEKITSSGMSMNAVKTPTRKYLINQIYQVFAKLREDNPDYEDLTVHQFFVKRLKELIDPRYIVSRLEIQGQLDKELERTTRKLAQATGYSDLDDAVAQLQSDLPKAFDALAETTGEDNIYHDLTEALKDIKFGVQDIIDPNPEILKITDTSRILLNTFDDYATNTTRLGQRTNDARGLRQQLKEEKSEPYTE